MNANSSIIPARECTRCLYSTDNVTGITFDDRGICNYCLTTEVMDREYPTGAEGKRRLEKIAAEIRGEGKGKRYDVVVGVSGGCDSSYMLVLAKELGLRPLAVHFDNTWNSTIAVENIQTVLRELDVDLYTYVVDNEEYDDIYRAFFRAGTPDLEAPTDLALASVLNMACEKYDIRYIFEGHCFRTEGISPLGWLYMDGKYISSVHKQFGTVPMKTFPNMPLTKFLRWTVMQGLVKIRPLYFLDYQKEPTKELLTREYGWQWYGGHHLENRFTAFYHTYFCPRRWGIDGRLLGHCALVRAGQLDKEQARTELAAAPAVDWELIDYVQKRLGLSDGQFHDYMTLPKKTYRDYPSYKRTFEMLRPLFYLLYKANRVPKSFYMKFCFPHKDVPFRGHSKKWLETAPGTSLSI